MAPQAFVPIHRRPKSELKGPQAASAPGVAAAPAQPAVAKPVPKPVKVKASRAKRSTGSFPVLPALAATLLVLGGVQAGIWWWGKNSSAHTPVPTAAATSNRAATDLPRPLGHMDVPALPQNLQFGDVQGRVTVTIFSDPACGACRVRIRELIGGLPNTGVRYVYKFWPDDPRQATSGLLMELARRQGVIAKFWSLLQAAGGENLDDTALLHLLDNAGVPLAAQRAALAEHTHTLTEALEPDLRVAASANLPAPPVLLVNTMLMDTASLTPDGLNRYVGQLLAGRDTPAPEVPADLRALLPR